MDENELKKIHSEKVKETEEHAKELSIGMFLLKTHEETFTNLDIISHDMASNIIKRYMMLSAEADGIDLILKVGGDKLYEDTCFKLFITKMNEYINKIKEDPEYKTIDEYKNNEELVYAKFKSLYDKIKDIP